MGNGWIRRTGLALGTILAIGGTARTAAPQISCAATLCFDGGEPGVLLGAVDFSFAGSSWSGGVVTTLRDPLLYTSGDFAYVVAAPFGSGLAEILFDEPVTGVELVFQHGGLSGIAPGALRSFDPIGDPVEEVGSEPGRGAATPHSFLDPTVPISRIELVGGVVDDFSFRPVPEPRAAAWLALAVAGWVAGRRIRARRRRRAA